MTDRELARIYRDAAAYLVEHGWVQKTMGFHGGPRCLVGAICTVAVPTQWHAARFSLLPYNSQWNDEPGRTAEEVIEVLLATAARLDPDSVVTLASPEPVEVLAC